jgi:hypothetical protein
MSTMVRTQIYLPRDVYDRLRQRSEREHVTMAEQIRDALATHLADASPGGALRPDDPLWTLVGAGEGPTDASEAHDSYLHGLNDHPA